MLCCIGRLAKGDRELPRLCLHQRHAAERSRQKEHSRNGSKVPEQGEATTAGRSEGAACVPCGGDSSLAAYSAFTQRELCKQATHYQNTGCKKCSTLRSEQNESNTFQRYLSRFALSYQPAIPVPAITKRQSRIA